MTMTAANNLLLSSLLFNHGHNEIIGSFPNTEPADVSFSASSSQQEERVHPATTLPSSSSSSSSSSSKPTTTTTTNTKDNSCVPFPWKIHEMLDDAIKNNNEDIVSWLPNHNNNAFKVHKPNEFVTQIMPKYFRQTRYKSFLRQLNIWGFQRINSSKKDLVKVDELHQGGYYHTYLIKGQPSLCHKMIRTKIKGDQSNSNNNSPNSNNKKKTTTMILPSSTTTKTNLIVDDDTCIMSPLLMPLLSSSSQSSLLLSEQHQHQQPIFKDGDPCMIFDNRIFHFVSNYNPQN